MLELLAGPDPDPHPGDPPQVRRARRYLATEARFVRRSIAGVISVTLAAAVLPPLAALIAPVIATVVGWLLGLGVLAVVAVSGGTWLRGAEVAKGARQVIARWEAPPKDPRWPAASTLLDRMEEIAADPAVESAVRRLRDRLRRAFKDLAALDRAVLADLDLEVTEQPSLQHLRLNAARKHREGQVVQILAGLRSVHLQLTVHHQAAGSRSVLSELETLLMQLEAQVEVEELDVEPRERAPRPVRSENTPER